MNILAHQQDRAWIEINKAALLHNLKQLENAADGSKIMAVVKDRFYGMGLEAVLILQSVGVDHFAVATIDEALQLRFIGVNKPILILGATAEERFIELHHYDLIQSLVTPTLCDQLIEFTETHKLPIQVHIKINTGMNRLGLPAMTEKDKEDLVHYYTHPYLKVRGTFTHLLASDQFDKRGDQMCRLQLERFDQVLAFLKEQNLPIGHTHVFNSSGIERYGKEFRFDYCRPGLYFAGTKAFPGYRNSFSLKARIAMIKALLPDDQIGYGYENTIKRPTKVATISIGYGDGLQRRLPGVGYQVFANRKACPILGRICMDLLMIDVSHVPEIAVGDPVTFIGDAFILEDMARLLGTIPNEVMTQFTSRLPRIVV